MGRRAPETVDPREAELSQLGLTRYQAAAYVRLHDLGTARPRQVAEAAGIPLARAYEALEDLVGRGLAEPVAGRSKAYRVLPLDGALDREVRHLQRIAETLRLETPRLVREYPVAESAPPTGFALHLGAARTRAAFEERVRGAAHLSGVVSWASACEAWGGPEGVAKLPWRALVVFAPTERMGEIATLVEAGLDARVLPEDPIRVEQLVVDGTRLVVRVPEAGSPVAVETDDASFVKDALQRVRSVHDSAPRAVDVLRELGRAATEAAEALYPPAEAPSIPSPRVHSLVSALSPDLVAALAAGLRLPDGTQEAHETLRRVLEREERRIRRRDPR